MHSTQAGMQDCVLQNVTSVNVFSVEDGGYVAAEGGTGAPGSAYNLTARGSAAVPEIMQVPPSRTAPLGPADDWWVAVRKVRWGPALFDPLRLRACRGDAVPERLSTASVLLIYNAALGAAGVLSLCTWFVYFLWGTVRNAWF